jgi:hypothetical protein
MDNPPPNYNPNESVFSGGLDAPIMKVMGGGGGLNGYNETVSMLEGGIEPITRVEGGGDGLPNGYNETVSMLEGGIEPITRVEGGRNTVPITFVLNYKNADITMVDNFLNGQSLNIDKAIEKMESILDSNSKKINTLHYIRINNEVESSSLNYKNSSSAINIYIIPKTTHTIIVLPPITSANDLFEQIQYLINNN